MLKTFGIAELYLDKVLRVQTRAPGAASDGPSRAHCMTREFGMVPIAPHGPAQHDDPENEDNYAIYVRPAAP